jgi:Domain of unknown function (DUF1840)
MLYKFKSKATGDVIMLGPNGDQVMRIVGREPVAKGIFEVGAIGAVVGALEAAVAAEEAAGAAAKAEPDGEAAAGPAAAVSLRSRVWPLVEMLRRAQRAAEPVVWGV